MKSLWYRITHLFDSAERDISAAVYEADQYIEPVRKSIFKRFPVLFILLGTFGVAATVFGFEQLMVRYQVLADHPTLILAIGLSTLVLTGQLYKKLG